MSMIVMQIVTGGLRGGDIKYLRKFDRGAASPRSS
jgi:hypothetical protein